MSEINTANMQAVPELRVHDWPTFTNRMLDRKYCLIHDQDREFPFADYPYRQHFLDTYFNAGVLQTEAYADVYPPDRQRAFAIIDYDLVDYDNWWLEEPPSATVFNRHSAEVRNYPRISIKADPVFERWVNTLLAVVVPVDAYYAHGQLSVHFFRTRTGVVSGFHRDDVTKAIMWGIDTSHCLGGVTTLAANDGTFIDSVRLENGDMLCIDDEEALHDVSDITPIDGGSDDVHRDLIVATIKAGWFCYPYNDLPYVPLAFSTHT